MIEAEKAHPPEGWSELLEKLVDAGVTVATAESLTGGRLAAHLTNAPGSSKAYAGGVVSYATEVKKSVLGVPSDLVDDHGVISPECARAMAEGVRDLMQTTFGISTTGVAGPDAQEGKPVGTVFVGIAGPAGTRVLPLELDGDRSEIQLRTVEAAVSELSAIMESEARAGRSAEDSLLR